MWENNIKRGILYVGKKYTERDMWENNIKRAGNMRRSEFSW